MRPNSLIKWMSHLSMDSFIAMPGFLVLSLSMAIPQIMPSIYLSVSISYISLPLPRIHSTLRLLWKSHTPSLKVYTLLLYSDLLDSTKFGYWIVINVMIGTSAGVMKVLTHAATLLFQVRRIQLDCASSMWAYIHKSSLWVLCIRKWINLHDNE